MNTNYSKVLRHFLFLLLAFAIVLPMAACTEKKPRVSRSDASSDTMTEEASKDVVVLQSNPAGNSGAPATTTATAKSSNAFEGTWDVDVNGNFHNWTFSYAISKDGKLEGKITDGSNAVIGAYVVFPNKTIELNAAGVNAILAYKVLSSGNRIEIDDNSTKVILTKGKTNTTAQNDGNILASRIWTNINNPSDRIEFLSVSKSASGWTGGINFLGGSGSASGTFALTPGKITITNTSTGSVNVYSYKLRNSNNTLDLTDPRGSTETYN